MTDMPRVSIIILNWNGLTDTIECLESLKKITYPNYDVIVIDNGSSGNDADVLKEKYTGYINLIRNKKNYGFAEGNNIGARYALEKLDPQYILLLNNDAIVEPQFMTELVKVAHSDNSIGIVGPKIYLFGTKIIDSAGSLFNNIGQCWSRGNLETDIGQYDKQEEVPMITACCCLIRREILEKTYLFDPYFFLYYEEFDLNIRTRGLGYKIIYMPSSIVHHKYSQSVEKASGGKASKYFYISTNRAVILTEYFPIQMLIRNSILILASYFYQSYLLLRIGGINWYARSELRLIRSIIHGIKRRGKIKKIVTYNWVGQATHHGFKNLFEHRNLLKHRIETVAKLKNDLPQIGLDEER
jgi:GT2 family glycosyltransferase